MLNTIQSPLQDQSPQKEKLPWQTTFTLLLVFAFSLNFLNRFSICILAAFCMLLLSTPKIRFSGSASWLFLFGISILIFSPYSGGIADVVRIFIKSLSYVMCYLIGANLSSGHKKQSDEPQDFPERSLRLIVLVLSAAMLVHLLLNFMINFNANDSRNMPDFWIDNAISATGQASIAVLVLATSLAIIFLEKRPGYKVFAIIGLAITLFYNLKLAGRTIFLLAVILYFLDFIYCMLIAKQLKGRSVIIFFIFLILVLILFLLFTFNLFGVRDTVEQSQWYLRFFGDNHQDLFDDSRWVMKENYLKHLLDYPLGGGHINKLFGYYAHDLLLDIYDDSGVFAAGSIIIFLLHSFVSTVRFLRNKVFSPFSKLLVFNAVVSIMIESFIEPIYQGMPWLLASFCMIIGAVDRANSRQPKSKLYLK